MFLVAENENHLNNLLENTNEGIIIYDKTIFYISGNHEKQVSKYTYITNGYCDNGVFLIGKDHKEYYIFSPNEDYSYKCLKMDIDMLNIINLIPLKNEVIILFEKENNIGIMKYDVSENKLYKQDIIITNIDSIDVLENKVLLLKEIENEYIKLYVYHNNKVYIVNDVVDYIYIQNEDKVIFITENKNTNTYSIWLDDNIIGHINNFAGLKYNKDNQVYVYTINETDIIKHLIDLKNKKLVYLEEKEEKIPLQELIKKLAE